MPRYVAFLRAINVGGRVVPMETLRRIFEELGLARVETFIASGNVIFESRAVDTAKLAAKIERELLRVLGYEVATMLRTDAEVADVSRATPFEAGERERAAALNVAFLPSAAAADANRALDALRTEIDAFHVDGREIYWLCRLKQSQSTFSSARFERLVGMPATWRNIKTVERLAAKYPEAGSAPQSAAPEAAKVSTKPAAKPAAKQSAQPGSKPARAPSGRSRRGRI